MRQAQIEVMGSIDDLVMEWSGEQPLTGEVMPLLLELVDRGVIRILDLAFLGKDEDGSVSAIDIAQLVQRDESLARAERTPPALDDAVV
jgi:hypothetical protein